LSEVLLFVLALAVGAGLGIIYFGGLWLTVKRLPTARRPVLLTLLSFAGRLGVVLMGFYLIMDGHWERLIVCLLAFLAVRAILVRRWGPDRTSLSVPAK
jgi:F1F0 ATPase subunit 2